MNAERKAIYRIINELPDDSLSDVINFIKFTLINKKSSVFKELEHASASSMDFWDNPIDDEVWNNA